MRTGNEPKSARYGLATEAIAQLEALEKSIRSALKSGTLDGNVVLAKVGENQPLLLVVAFPKKDRTSAVAWWRVATEEEGRDVAQAQSLCEGQKEWMLRVFRGDTMLAVYRNGKERFRRYWSPEAKAREAEVRPSKIGVVCYSVSIRTDTGVLRDVLSVESKEAALAFHETKWREDGYHTCTFRAYETTPSGQRTLLGTFARGRELKPKK